MQMFRLQPVKTSAFHILMRMENQKKKQNKYLLKDVIMMNEVREKIEDCIDCNFSMKDFLIEEGSDYIFIRKVIKKDFNVLEASYDEIKQKLREVGEIEHLEVNNKNETIFVRFKDKKERLAKKVSDALNVPLEYICVYQTTSSLLEDDVAIINKRQLRDEL